MLVPNRHGSSTAYRYGFNGMEKDDELKGIGNSYDFGARMFDPRVGRWFAPDPLEKDFPFISTYVYALNNPLNIVDEDGKAPDPVIIKYLQIAINNMPKIKAYAYYNYLSEKVYGEYHKDKKIDYIASRLPYSDKYIWKKSWDSTISSNSLNGSGNLNFYGIDLDISYSVAKRDNMNSYNILNFDWKEGKNGKPHLYGGGGISDSNSGFFLEMGQSISNTSTPLVKVGFNNLKELLMAKEKYNSEKDKTLNNLLNMDPLIKMYHNLKQEYEKLSETNLKLNNNPDDTKLKAKYDTQEKKYNENSKKYLKMRNKAYDYLKSKKKNG
jgi:RHS repeat-associated protein